MTKDEETPDQAFVTLTTRRAGKRQSLTKTLNELASGLPEDLASLDHYLDKCRDLDNQLISLDEEIQNIILSRENSDKEYLPEMDTCEKYSDRLRLTISKLRRKIFELEPNEGNTNNGNNRSLPKLSLPKLELPTFDGKPEEFSKFIESFETILMKFDLSQFEKFSYLMQQVSGPAREIVSSVQKTGTCYGTAKKLLVDAFSSKTIQQFAVIDKIRKLSLKSDNNYYQWVSNCRVLVDQVNALNIDSELFMQYFIWKSIPEKYKNMYMNITNNSTPSLEEILENAFDVHNRMKELVRSENFYAIEPRESVTMATAAKPRSKTRFMHPCQLCVADDLEINEHNIKHCPKYETPQAKINKIRLLNGCTKCGLLNHTIGACKYRFPNKCSICGM